MSKASAGIGAGAGAGSGALTGAAIGTTVFPGLGTLAGAGIGALAGGIAGWWGGKEHGPKADPELDTLIAQLKDSGAANKRTGATLSGAGMDQLQPVLDYFKKLSGGDPSAVLSATQPERGRVIDQYDTARSAIANFSPRGGGSNSAAASSYSSEANQLTDITSAARTNAANQSAQIGTTLTGLGLSADQLASADLNTIVQAILAKKGQALQQRGQNMDAAAGAGEALGTILALKYLNTGKPAGATT